MKMYSWKPKGHGELSCFVMAETEAEAIYAVEKYISDQKIHDEFCGFGTDYYTLTIADAGTVIVNNNN